MISLNAYHEYKDNDNFLDIQANTMLFNTNNTVFAQKIVEKSHEFGGFGKYTHKLGKHILSASTGYNALFQKANYQNINEIKDNLDRKYLFSNLSITHKKTRFEYGAMAELRHYLTENKTFILPELIVKYHFKQDLHLVEAKYKREINFPTILNLNNIEYANDFRNYYMTSALDSNTEVLQNIYELHYLFMDLYRGITLFGYSKYLKNKDIITQNYNFTNNTNYITNQVANGGFQWINYINFSLNLFKIKQKIEISANYNLIDRPFYRNGFLDKNDIKSSSVEFNILSNFKNKPYSYIAGIQLKNTTNNIQNSGQKITLTEYIPKIDLTINFTKRITGYFNHNYHIASSDGLENNFWELNYKIYYQKEKSKWNWYITAENFLHLKGNNALNSAERNTYFETQQIGRLAGFIGLGCIFEF
ncbi:MAG: hypothetical protein Q4C98_06530 [Capnocytophaga sp.]|nr:hypothetical protein [Capnocytophaga sp.]